MVCTKYKDRVRRLSGLGMQISPALGQYRGLNFIYDIFKFNFDILGVINPCDYFLLSNQPVSFVYGSPQDKLLNQGLNLDHQI